MTGQENKDKPSAQAPQTGKPISQPRTGHTSAVNSAAFSPDGKTLASGGDNKTILLWDFDPHSWIEKSCKRACRNSTQAEWAKYFHDEDYRVTCTQWHWSRMLLQCHDSRNKKSALLKGAFCNPSKQVSTPLAIPTWTIPSTTFIELG